MTALSLNVTAAFTGAEVTRTGEFLLKFDVAGECVSAFADIRRGTIIYPHCESESGRSRGADVDEAVLRSARATVETIRAAQLWAREARDRPW